jgi:hypothetical protein
MATSIPLVWYIAMGVGFGLCLGYAVGTTIGTSSGKRQLIKKIKLLLRYEKVDINLDKLLRSKHSQLIKEDFLP